MKKALVYVLMSLFFGGCGGKSVIKHLERAAKIAAGPCGEKVAEAAVICKAEVDAFKK